MGPATTALIVQRRLSGPYDAAALRALPKGTLGNTYATALGAMGHDIIFFPGPDFYANLETDADYINYRVYATHDIHHIISGFSLDNFGGLGVISMSVAQFSHPALQAINNRSGALQQGLPKPVAALWGSPVTHPLDEHTTPPHARAEDTPGSRIHRIPCRHGCQIWRWERLSNID